MKFLERAKKIFLGRGNKRKIDKVHTQSKVQVYEIVQEERSLEWEKQFEEYTSFPIDENNETFIISINFKPEETRKEEISNFVKDGLEKRNHISNVMAGVGIIYGLGVAHRGIKEQNKILQRRVNQKGTIYKVPFIFYVKESIKSYNHVNLFII